MTEHEHDFVTPRGQRPGTITWCRVEGCNEMRIRHHRKVVWRELTAEELITVTAHMMEATAIGQAMVMIHGRERGLQRAREVLGYE